LIGVNSSPFSVQYIDPVLGNVSHPIQLGEISVNAVDIDRKQNIFYALSYDKEVFNGFTLLGYDITNDFKLLSNISLAMFWLIDFMAVDSDSGNVYIIGFHNRWNSSLAVLNPTTQKVKEITYLPALFADVFLDMIAVYDNHNNMVWVQGTCSQSSFQNGCLYGMSTSGEIQEFNNTVMMETYALDLKTNLLVGLGIYENSNKQLERTIVTFDYNTGNFSVVYELPNLPPFLWGEAVVYDQENGLIYGLFFEDPNNIQLVLATIDVSSGKTFQVYSQIASLAFIVT